MSTPSLTQDTTWQRDTGIKTRFSSRRAIAEHLGEDVATIEAERRYQPGRTPCAVYTIGNDYLAASPNAKPPKGDRNYKWEQIPSMATSIYGWTIWRNIEP